MIDAGLAVVLATDFNPGSSPSASMPMMLSLAVTQMRMSPAEAITAATVNAAASLNRVDKIGSLEVGKLANFAIYDCEDYRELTYWFGISLMRDVCVQRRICFKELAVSKPPSDQRAISKSLSVMQLAPVLH